MSTAENLAENLSENLAENFLSLRSNASGYRRHKPEETLLYKVVQENLATVFQDLEFEEKRLPAFVREEFDAFLDCGILSKGFLRLRCEKCGNEKLVAFSCKKRGFCPSCGGRRMADTAAHLVDNVFPVRPVRQWVLSFPYNLRYLFAYNAKALHQALQVMIRVIRRYYLNKGKIERGERGRKSKKGNKSKVESGANKVSGKVSGNAEAGAETGAVTLIQRFGGSVNLNVHMHVLFLDGVFGADDGAWTGVPAPTDEEVAEIILKIRQRVFRSLEKSGYIKGFDVNFDTDELYNEQNGFAELLIGSIRGVKCFGEGSARGRKIGTVGATCTTGVGHWVELRGNRCAYKDGFSLHANVCIPARDREGLEHLCRYIARPPIANERLSLNHEGNILYKLKRPWNDGSTHVKFTPEEMIGRLISLVPPPRIHLIRFFGVLAPNAKMRKLVVPAKKEKEKEGEGENGEVSKNELEEGKEAKRYRIQWARLLKRVFKVEVTRCGCGGTLKIIAAITTSNAIAKILGHFSLPAEAPVPFPARAPPQIEMMNIEMEMDQSVDQFYGHGLNHWEN